MALTPAQQWLEALKRTHAPAPDYTQQWQQALATTHPPQQVAPDTAYLGQVAANDRPYQTGLAQLPGNLQALGSQYGYSYSQDPTNPLNVTVGGVDTSNPYSRAALLQRSYDNTKRGNTTSLAARGQLYSGALQNAQNTAFTNFNQASTENRAGFENAIRGYVNSLGQVGAERDVANTGAFGDLVTRAANDPNIVEQRTNPLPAPPTFFSGQSYPAPKRKKKK
jgi:hypothetical protein